MVEINHLKPYISVNGVTNAQEAQALTTAFKGCLPPGFSHQGAIGFLVNPRTLEGINDHPDKFPGLSQLPLLLAQTKDAVLTAIHFNSNNRQELSGQIKKLFSVNSIYQDQLCRTVQLNIPWPDVTQVEEIKTALPDLKIILALTPQILKRLSKEEIADRVGDYRQLVDYILVDPSGSKGISFGASWVAPYFRVLRHYHPDKQIILAGGFDEANVHLRAIQIAHALQTREFGLDAQSGLRDKDGKLSLIQAVRFIEEAAAFFSPTNGLSPEIEVGHS